MQVSKAHGGDGKDSTTSANSDCIEHATWTALLLSGGKTNLGIQIIDVNGKPWVHRKYQAGVLGESAFWRMLHVAFVVGLVPAVDWTYKREGDAVVIGNPLLDVVQHDSVPRPSLWRSYEELLRRLMLMWREYRYILGDCHSLNLRLCAFAGGALKVQLLDGKLGGMSSQPSTSRLYVKLKHETNPLHTWLLYEYIQFLKRNGVH